MRSVMMIAYGFPPEANAGASRPIRFVRCLSAEGWRVTVLTSDPSCYERYDPETLNLIPEHTRVLRVRPRDPWQSLQAKRSEWIQRRLPRVGPTDRRPMEAAAETRLRTTARALVRRAEAL